jgi:hypothetical protein
MPKRIIKAIKKVKHQANQENIAKFLYKNKAKFVKIFAVCIVISGLYGAFAIFKNSQAKKYSAILHESLIAQQNGDLKTAKEKLLNITQSKFVPANVSAIANFRYAGFLIEEGKKKEASEIYFSLNNCFNCNDYLSDLAGYLAVSTWLADEELMKLDYSDKIASIHKKSSVLKFHIAEQRAFYEMQKNNLEIADKIFDEIIEKAKENKDIIARAQDGKKILLQKGFKKETSDIKDEKNAHKDNKFSDSKDQKDDSKNLNPQKDPDNEKSSESKADESKNESSKNDSQVKDSNSKSESTINKSSKKNNR